MGFNSMEFMPNASEDYPDGGQREQSDADTEQSSAGLKMYTVLGPPELEPALDIDITGTPSETVEEHDLEIQESIPEAIQRLAFEDINHRRYIDERLPNGFHCMDYAMDEAGIQLPGGFTETLLFANYMNPNIQPAPMSQAYPAAAREAIDEWGIVSYHHNKCAAALHKQASLGKNYIYEQEAKEFTHTILKELDLLYSETDSDIEVAIMTGADNASNLRLWDIDFYREKGTELARRVGAPYEILKKNGGSKPIGLRIDTSPYRFNSALFRQDHIHESVELGVYSVSLGAFRDELARRQMKERSIARMVMSGALFTHGLAQHVGDEYLRAAVIKPRNSS